MKNKKNEYFLVSIKSNVSGKEVTGVMLNAYRFLMVSDCNSESFKHIHSFEEHVNSTLEINQFCNTSKQIIKQLDMRTKESKDLIKQYGYLNANTYLSLRV
jgi:coenzyme F420-reducing hydrogenase alpha subunit